MPRFIYLLLTDLDCVHLTAPYRQGLVGRLDLLHLTILSTVVDLTNMLLGLYGVHCLRGHLQPGTTAALRGPFPLDLVLLLKSYLTIVTNTAAWQRPHALWHDERFRRTTAELFYELTPHVGSAVVDATLDRSQWSDIRTAYDQLVRTALSFTPAFPLTAEIIAPSVYTSWDASPDALFQRATELLRKECYPPAGSALFRLKSQLLQLQSERSTNGDPTPTGLPVVTLDTVEFYLRLNRILWALSDMAQYHTTLRAVPVDSEAHIWDTDLPDLITRHAATPYPVVMRLAVYCIHFHQFTRFVQIIQWVSANRSYFIQNDYQMRGLSILPGICLIMEKFRAANVDQDALFAQYADPAHAAAAPQALLELLNPEHVTEIRRSAAQTAHTLVVLTSEVREELFAAFRRYLRDPYTLLALMTQYASVAWKATQPTAADLLGSLTLLAAPLKEVVTTI
ncbi:hypothetical protein IWQ60_012572, partial [Tieghemiomyces parasiticus]